MRLGSDQFYFRSPDEMSALFSYCPEAISNTALVAEKCNLTLNFDQFFLPKFDVEDDRTLDDHLQELAYEGWAKLRNNLDIESSKLLERYEERIRMELEIIKSMGFAGSFSSFRISLATPEKVIFL